jgi:hypothetical protein
MVKPSDQRAPEKRTVWIGPAELAALLLQSMVLAASFGFMLATMMGRFTSVPRALAFGIGLEVGLLISYPTMRIIARSGGTSLPFLKWIAITLVPAALGITLVSVL